MTPQAAHAVALAGNVSRFGMSFLLGVTAFQFRARLSLTPLWFAALIPPRDPRIGHAGLRRSLRSCSLPMRRSISARFPMAPSAPGRAGPTFPTAPPLRLAGAADAAQHDARDRHHHCSTALSLVLACVAALLSWRFVEKPLIGLKKPLSARPSRIDAGVSGPPLELALPLRPTLRCSCRRSATGRSTEWAPSFHRSMPPRSTRTSESLRQNSRPPSPSVVGTADENDWLLLPGEPVDPRRKRADRQVQRAGR